MTKEQKLNKEIDKIMEWAKKEEWFCKALVKDWRIKPEVWPPEWMMEN